ncbi:histidine phosphatase family protein [Ningiella sp. W23]|uniref:histidine phosphatase family protein n=1 Tax=Ningiella sp. W23 TaxID=3023715 RepID=UPI003756B31C
MWIYLTRHAETQGNIARIVQTPDTPLTSRGHKQAEALANYYKHMPISHILRSDYARTQDSAKPIHQSLSCKLTLEPILRKRNFGDLLMSIQTLNFIPITLCSILE